MNRIEESEKQMLPIWAQHLLEFQNNSPVLVLNNNQEIIYINDQAKLILDLDKNLKNGDNIRQILGLNQDLRDTCNEAKELLEQKTPKFFIKKIKTRTYAIALNPLFNKDNVSGFSLVFTDTTETQQREKENTLLHQLAISLNQNLATNDLLKNLLEKIIFIMDLEAGSILTMNHRDQKLYNIKDSPNIGNKGFKIGEGIAGFVAQTGQPLSIIDIKAEKRFIDKNNPRESCSLLCLPLMTKNKLFGILNLEKKPGIYFSESEMQVFSAVSSRIAVFLENERLNKWSEQRLELAKTLSSTIELRPLTEKSICKIKQILDVDNCAVFLWREHHNIFKGYASTDLSAEEIAKIQFNIALDKIEIALQNMTVPLKLNHAKETVFTKTLVKELNYKNAIGLPLLVKGRFNGLLIINISSNGRKLDADEINLATDLSNQLGMAIENADLYGKSQREIQILDSIQMTTDQGIILLNNQKNIIYHNLAVNKLFKLKKTILNVAIDDLARQFGSFSKLKTIKKQPLIELAQKNLNEDHSFDCEIKSVDHPIKHLSINVKILTNESEKRNYLITIDDISDLKNLQDKISDRLWQITQLFKISSLSAKEPKQTIKRIMSQLPELLQAQDIILSVPNQEGKIETIGSGLGQTQNWPEFLDKISQNELMNKSYLYPQDATALKIEREVMPKNLKNFLVYPILINGGFNGVLFAGNKLYGRKFTRDDARLLSIIVKQIAAIMENEQLLEEIRLEKERLGAIISHSADGMILVNDKNEIVSWNRAMEQLTGYGHREAIGQKADDLIHLKDNKSFTLLIDEAAKIKRQNNISEVEIIAKNGESKWLDLHYAKPADNKKMKFKELVVLFNDVSKYKELDIEKNEFISMTAHELRTPLTAIKGYLSMIIDGDAGPLNEKQEKYFGRTYKSTERLVSLVEDLLNFLRIEEKRVIFNIVPTNLKQISKEVLLDFGQKSLQKEIKLELKSTLTGMDLAMADPDRTKQIIANLVDNAIKYTPRGGKIVVKLSKDNRGKKSYLVTEVTDNGVGIADEQILNIFNKFHRVDNPLSTQAGGYGLGLFITRSLVEQQGGEIWVKSVLGEGSKFSFSLPAK